MKVKKVLFYAAPVALAGFLYIGEATGIGEVLAKTVKTVIKTETKGKWIRDISISFYSVDDKFIDEYYDENDTPYYKRYERITETEIQTEVPDDPQSSDVSVKVVPTAIEKAREEAAVKVQKEAEQKTEDFAKEIAKMTEQAIQASAKTDEVNGEAAGTPTAVIKTDYFTCFTQGMLKQLAANPNVNYEIHYRYQGKRYVVVIPAGTDYSQLKDSNGYYGFRWTVFSVVMKREQSNYYD